MSGPYLVEEKQCRRCRVHMTLIEGYEWPETDNLIYCSGCSIDVIRELRAENKRLKRRFDTRKGTGIRKKYLTTNLTNYTNTKY